MPQVPEDSAVSSSNCCGALDSWAPPVLQALKASGVAMVAYVPDEVVDPLLRLVHEDPTLTVVPVTREEEGVAVLAGGYLGGTRGTCSSRAAVLGTPSTPSRACAWPTRSRSS